MKIAVASGKGGVGKTTIAVSLALAADIPVQYVDCDVEEPNGHIFLRPVLDQCREITLTVPEIIEEKCTGCGECRDICRFNAITVFGVMAMAFNELCHACGGCFLVCPEAALVRGKRLLGILETGQAGKIRFSHGILRVGEAMSVPLIAAVREAAEQEGGLIILDAPPGTSCPLIATIIGADYTLLVSEETPFGLHDLQLAVGVLRKLDQHFGVIINRADLGDGKTGQWCRRENIPVHLEIPFERGIAEGYAAGKPLIHCRPELLPVFASLLKELTS
ncbi:ATP-binding protein [Thiovibrio frasassiensis]|uniref:ATP-binding protein n=1 Tax=Thiovibrio frasassiensis TaxID=2984131 RepID=A0A9X4RKE9_9BACT|nr:ATP-binding protein [Thiovibrio frasassiensis]MDG4474981.1 ATP-binding protein [Thiovibrio frasassiensis]